MRRKLMWIAAAAALSLSGAASATVRGQSEDPVAVRALLQGTPLVQGRHYAGADQAQGNRLQWQLAAEGAATTCEAPEPSKLGLLRSNQTSPRKAKVLCRKLKS